MAGGRLAEIELRPRNTSAAPSTEDASDESDDDDEDGRENGGGDRDSVPVLGHGRRQRRRRPTSSSAAWLNAAFVLRDNINARWYAVAVACAAFILLLVCGIASFLIAGGERENNIGNSNSNIDATTGPTTGPTRPPLRVLFIGNSFTYGPPSWWGCTS
jgi:hypothetical protein